MSTFTSKPTVINRPAEELFNRFADLSYLQESLDKLPAEELAKVGDVKFTPDSITITTPQVGEIKFVVKERKAPGRVVFGTESSPVPLTMAVDFKPLTADTTEAVTAIDVEIPAIVRPIIGPQIQKAADKFGELISHLSR